MPSPLAGRRVLLGVTGGIAAYKSAYLARLLRDRGAEVQVVMTPSAPGHAKEPLTGRCPRQGLCSAEDGGFEPPRA